MDPLQRVPCKDRNKIGCQLDISISKNLSDVEVNSIAGPRREQLERGRKKRESGLTFGELFAPLTPCQIAPPVSPIALRVQREISAGPPSCSDHARMSFHSQSSSEIVEDDPRTVEEGKKGRKSELSPPSASGFTPSAIITSWSCCSPRVSSVISVGHACEKKPRERKGKGDGEGC